MNILCHLVVATGFFMSLLLGINYLGRHTDRSCTERVVVTRVYSENHYHSRRVGRRYVRGDSYLSYHINVMLPDGYEKKMTVNAAKFRSYHKGDTVSVKLTPGALGMTILGR